MHLGPDTPCWVVLDPTPSCGLGAVLYETTLRGLDLQLRGGLSMEKNPTIFTDGVAAEAEARRRFLAVGVAEAIRRSPTPVARVHLYDADGGVVFEGRVEDVVRGSPEGAAGSRAPFEGPGGFSSDADVDALVRRARVGQGGPSGSPRPQDSFALRSPPSSPSSS